MIKLLAIDMDGTCLNDKHRISEENLAAMRAAAASGIWVVPTTGRTTTCLPLQLQGETFYRYIISSNGADVADRGKQTSLYRAQIPCGQAAALLRECGAAGLGLSIHAKHRFIVQGAGLNLLGRAMYGPDARNTKYERNIVRLLEREKTDVEEIQLFFFTDRKRVAARRLLTDRPGFVTAYDRFYAEIYAPEASKGHALTALARQLGVSQEEVACIGDAENDLSMFHASGMKIAVSNAIAELKEQADAVVADNNSSGVAEAIRRYLLT